MALNRMMDISDITLVTMSGLIVVVSSAVIIAVNYRRLPCFNRERLDDVEDVVHVIQEDGQQAGSQSAPKDWVTVNNRVITATKKV